MINTYKFDLKNPNIFSIDTPPPTVSGHLHMGHVFSYCHADFIARFQRMSGKNVFYPIGFDDNGLPTERLVEKITGVKVGFNFSEKSKATLKEMMGVDFDGVCSKENFVEICRFVVKDAEIEFEKLFKSINLSVDWDYKYQSISDNSANIAQTAFKNLLSKGLIYQKNAPVYWCTQDKTATANAEIEDIDMKGVQIEFNFDLENGEKIRIMTTRPEMIPACRALLFNSEDERFNGKKIGEKVIVKIGDENKEFIGKNYAGKFAINPITGEKIPMLADQDVKIEKGTGVVMCCTYGDWQDVIWTKRHNLSEKIIVSEDGKMEFSNFAKYDTEVESVCGSMSEFIIRDNSFNEWLVLTKHYHNRQQSGQITLNDLQITATYNSKKNSGNIFYNPHLDTSSENIKTEQLTLTKEDVVYHNSRLNYLKIEDARKKMIEILENSGDLLSKIDITHPVKCAERSGRPLEIIPTPQWYVRVLPFKKVLLQMSKLVKFRPEGMRIKLENWINGLSQDWCISRNRFFGIDIPMTACAKDSKLEWSLELDEKWLAYDKNRKDEEKWLLSLYASIPLQGSFDEARKQKLIKDSENINDNIKKYTMHCIARPPENHTNFLINDAIANYIKYCIENKLDSPYKNVDDFDKIRSPQVLDTWFTSGLSPHLSNILHENFADKNKAVNFTKSPIGSMSLRPQAHEIIRTWTFVTLVQSYLNLGVEIIDKNEAGGEIFDLENDEIEITGEFAIAKSENFGKTVYLKCKKPDTAMLPWENVMLSGWCLASDKTKMSKSKGNIVTPTGLIEDFGADAVRYWAGSSTLGSDTAYNEGQIKIGQKLVTKLQNASKLCLQTISKSEINSKTHEEILTMQSEITNENDLAIIAKAFLVAEKYQSSMNEYEYSKALDAVEKFFWNDFCDNYLELAKTRSYGTEAQIYNSITLSDDEKNAIIKQQNSSAVAMYVCLFAILTHFAVFLPNICDKIYLESIFKDKIKKNSIHKIGILDTIKITNRGLGKIEIFDKIVEVLNEVRKAKSEKSLSIKAEVSEIFVPSNIFNQIFNTKAALDLLFASNCNNKLQEGKGEIEIKI